jgi:hypothetical protein
MGRRDTRGKLFVGKPEGRRSLGRPRCRWTDNIKMILEGNDGVLWARLDWPRIGTGGVLLLMQ